jgi:hypothetical protein
MNRIILPIIVVVVLIVGYGVGQLTAPPKASAPVLVNSPTVATRQIAPNMQTGGAGAISTAAPPSAAAASSPKYWYGPDREEVRAGLEASIKKYKEEHQSPPPGAKLQPLNVQ